MNASGRALVSPRHRSPWAQAQLPVFASLLLAFLEPTHRLGHSTLAIDLDRSHHWVAQVAQWLDRDARSLDPRLATMPRQAERNFGGFIQSLCSVETNGMEHPRNARVWKPA